jgi:hypothetical protein
MARTAVISGTATAVSNRVSRRQAQRWRHLDDEDQARAQAPYGGPEPAPQAATPGGADPVMAELERLADMRRQGLLSDEEFSAAKAKLLGL